LRTDLRIMRDAIDNYTLDKQEPPHSLQDLVDAGYVREIPVDPITYEADWVPVIGEIELSPNQKVVGLYEIHSNSKPYSTW
jgi:general secretion pathway protein G